MRHAIQPLFLEAKIFRPTNSHLLINETLMEPGGFRCLCLEVWISEAWLCLCKALNFFRQAKKESAGKNIREVTQGVSTNHVVVLR